MNATTTKTGVTLKLDTEEAVALEALLAVLSGKAARTLPWYDEIANALEHEKHNLLGGRTIYDAIREREASGALPAFDIEAARGLVPNTIGAVEIDFDTGKPIS
jgi:hypothetical protein